MSTTEPDPTSSRPLSAPAAIGVAGLSAALVIGAGVLVAEGFTPRRPATPLVAPPLPSLAAPIEPSASATAPASIEPPVASIAPPPASAPALASVSAAPSASAPPSAAPSSLPADRASLFASGPAEARVYLNGADVGPANQPLLVSCGPRYVRLGTVSDKAHPPSWLTPGKSLVLTCGTAQRIELTP